MAVRRRTLWTLVLAVVIPLSTLSLARTAVAQLPAPDCYPILPVTADDLVTVGDVIEKQVLLSAGCGDQRITAYSFFAVSLPIGLSISPASGWITGTVAEQQVLPTRWDVRVDFVYVDGAAAGVAGVTRTGSNGAIVDTRFAATAAVPVPAPTATPVAQPTATPAPGPTATRVPAPAPTATAVPLPTTAPTEVPLATAVPAPKPTTERTPTVTAAVDGEATPTSTPVPGADAEDFDAGPAESGGFILPPDVPDDASSASMDGTTFFIWFAEDRSMDVGSQSRINVVFEQAFDENPPEPSGFTAEEEESLTKKDAFLPPTFTARLRTSASFVEVDDPDREITIEPGTRESPWREDHYWTVVPREAKTFEVTIAILGPDGDEPTMSSPITITVNQGMWSRLWEGLSDNGFVGGLTLAILTAVGSLVFERPRRWLAERMGNAKTGDGDDDPEQDHDPLAPTVRMANKPPPVDPLAPTVRMSGQQSAKGGDNAATKETVEIDLTKATNEPYDPLAPTVRMKNKPDGPDPS